MPRKQFTNSQRLELLALSRERLALGESLKSICRDLGIQPKQIRHWRSREDVIAAASGDKKSTAPGRPPGSGKNSRSSQSPTVVRGAAATVQRRRVNSNNSQRRNGAARAAAMAGGNEQDIHGNTSQLQEILNQCFRHTTADGFRKTGILEAAHAAAARGVAFRVLEVGCGSGAATLDLATMLPYATTKITAIDADPEFIATAKQRQQEISSSLGPSEGRQFGEQRISFLELQGDQVGTKFPNQFDAVWIRLLIHAPDPMPLLTSAIQSLVAGGTLFVEAMDSRGDINDPSWMANTWLHRCHEKVSLSLGANSQRGSQIGRYLHSLGSQVTDIQCDSFAPLYGKGVKLRPWCQSTTTALGTLPSQEELYALGMALVKGTLEALTTKLLSSGVATQRDIDLAWISIEQVEDDNLTPYQIFSFPGGNFFQWWARKA